MSISCNKYQFVLFLSWIFHTLSTGCDWFMARDPPQVGFLKNNPWFLIWKICWNKAWCMGTHVSLFGQTWLTHILTLHCCRRPPISSTQLTWKFCKRIFTSGPGERTSFWVIPYWHSYTRSTIHKIDVNVANRKINWTLHRVWFLFNED